MEGHDILDALADGPLATGALADRWDVSGQTIRNRLSALRADGLVRPVGRGRAVRWERTHDLARRWTRLTEAGAPQAEDQLWREVKGDLGARWDDLSSEAQGVLDYGVTEMLNNAIDHSGSDVVRLALSFGAEDVEVVVADDGVGVFAHVRRHMNLPTDADAVSTLSKGKQTTAPDRHTGQGIFFTSKAVDRFRIESGTTAWTVDTLRADQALGSTDPRPGTRVLLRLARASRRPLKSVFDPWTEPDDLGFVRTRVPVRLADHGDVFVSRSEAKRLAVGLDLYGEVELDFAGVREVGQGFVDELFRVWPADHPGTELHPVRMSELVAFMVERGLPPLS